MTTVVGTPTAGRTLRYRPVSRSSVDYDAHPGRFRGHGIDLLPLTEAGVAEARVLGTRLSAQGSVDAIVSSPMAKGVLHRYVGAGDVAVVTHAGVFEALTGVAATACCGVLRYELL